MVEDNIKIGEEVAIKNPGYGMCRGRQQGELDTDAGFLAALRETV